jgi:hypothetical protein
VPAADRERETTVFGDGGCRLLDDERRCTLGDCISIGKNLDLQCHVS